MGSLDQQVQIKTDGTLSSSAGTYTRDWGLGAAAIATAMGYDTTLTVDGKSGKTGYSAIACLGYTDAAAAVTAGGTELTYNGVPFSFNNIINGTYTLWGNEYLYQTYNMGYAGQSANVHQAYLNLFTGIPANCDGNVLINTTQMKATRTGAASDIVHLAN